MFFLALYQLILTISSIVCKLFKSLLAPFNATFIWEVVRCLFAFHTPPLKKFVGYSVHEENSKTRDLQSKTSQQSVGKSTAQKWLFFNPVE